MLALAVRAGHAARALASPPWEPRRGRPGVLLPPVHPPRAFPKGKGPVRGLLHHLFDASHADHHARPWDGNHINGHLDTLFVAVGGAAQLPGAGGTTGGRGRRPVRVLRGEEWAHHAMHFWNFRWRYFQYLRARHLFHHSRHGAGTAFGITSDFWDKVFGTRIPAPSAAASPRRAAPRPGARMSAARRVLVTGASSGLGREMARQLGARGFRVAVTGRREAELREAARQAEREGGEGLPLVGSVTDREVVARHYATIRERWGGIDWAILNAGVGDSVDARSFSAEPYQPSSRSTSSGRSTGSRPCCRG